MSERRSVDPRKSCRRSPDGGREESKAMRALEEGNPTMHGETLATAGLPIILDGTRNCSGWNENCSGWDEDCSGWDENCAEHVCKYFSNGSWDSSCYSSHDWMVDDRIPSKPSGIRFRLDQDTAQVGGCDESRVPCELLPLEHRGHASGSTMSDTSQNQAL